MHVQLADRKLKDTKGGYAQFLRENKSEAKVMEDKEKRVKEIEQSTIKAKSKVSCMLLPLKHPSWPGRQCGPWQACTALLVLKSLLLLEASYQTLSSASV